MYNIVLAFGQCRRIGNFQDELFTAVDSILELLGETPKVTRSQTTPDDNATPTADLGWHWINDLSPCLHLFNPGNASQLRLIRTPFIQLDLDRTITARRILCLVFLYIFVFGHVWQSKLTTLDCHILNYHIVLHIGLKVYRGHVKYYSLLTTYRPRYDLRYNTKLVKTTNRNYDFGAQSFI